MPVQPQLPSEPVQIPQQLSTLPPYQQQTTQSHMHVQQSHMQPRMQGQPLQPQLQHQHVQQYLAQATNHQPPLIIDAQSMQHQYMAQQPNPQPNPQHLPMGHNQFRMEMQPQFSANQF